MKQFKYFFSTLFTLLLLCTIFVVTVLYQAGIPTRSSVGIEQAYAYISDIAKSVNQPKLLLVAGSNVSFGMSCEMIFDATEVPCINTGVHAGVDIDYIFYRARSWLKAGDTVLLPLEYNHYLSDGVPTSAFVDYVIGRDPDYIKSSGLVSGVRIIGGIEYARLLEGLKAKFNPSARGYVNIANYKDRNRFGDIIINTESRMTDDYREKLEQLEPFDYVKGSITPSHGLRTIKNFIDWCHSHQIKVLATYPNTMWFEAYTQPQAQSFFKSIEDFYKTLDVTVLGKAEDFMYDISMFYDSRYHLNDRGVRYRTREVINLLKPYLES
ncbi:MAG: hypothetical protein SWJ54_06720 [Cyanobacteriota bacterium]|nr:hypothetical protein [Cyanobacteriota bacterium]